MLAPVKAAELQVDDLAFIIQRSSRRKTLQITVERNGDLIMSAPPGVKAEKLRTFAIEKRFWIYTKLAEKDRLHRKTPRKEFIDGEGFLYLGRCHRLKLVARQDVPLRLTGGRFSLNRDALSEARGHFIQWYAEHAHAWLAACVNEHRARMGVEPAGVRVQDLGYRWGSCGKGDWLYFHWKSILLPARIAQYVVVHEMAHLHERHHTPTFWRRVERAMPDFAQRKAWLAEHGMDVEGV